MEVPTRLTARERVTGALVKDIVSSFQGDVGGGGNMGFVGGKLLVEFRECKARFDLNGGDLPSTTFFERRALWWRREISAKSGREERKNS